ncbi:unnamed protein product [Adineta steineri]|uniref:NAD-dependent protein deacylase n=1 Tax=Adineta steineri TaxID=433720 RepID=A0A815PQ21_9BILA|nr:unnamed protein product [Adineta steineri]CAF4049906.1 unnamed protein product [Adineta steineri]
MTSMTGPEFTEFRELFAKARSVLVLTGAGISAESGVPTFRGSGGFWRTYQATDLATPEAFERSPSLVWEFYQYRRELMRTKEPNKGHFALAEAEKRFESEEKRFVLVTQNIDGLHRRAGSQNLIEMHGRLFTTRCTSCGFTEDNYDSPICEALRNRGLPDQTGLEIPIKDLPSCRQCQSLVRPNVVWFGEALDRDIVKKIDEEIAKCDLFLVIGTSAVVYPAAAYASWIARRGVPVAEINIESTPSTSVSTFHFEGPSGELLPILLAPTTDDTSHKDS